MTKTKLTRRQYDVYTFVVNFEKENERTPTLREIAAGLGLNSHSSVGVHMKHLREKGKLS